ncbi:hypothetical protein EJ06DRAFT_530408 [Trichodelitschia bisporula]|uniref:Uncharacterized protein n=1 Tax=Trichodelitschia bisporula TaxID=703511 RepID=A0A6G1HXH1_9PEZI|nr:hypothetical protein EJ06DRAFT_530408 [Trichodelitschia bisporula]
MRKLPLRPSMGFARPAPTSNRHFRTTPALAAEDDAPSTPRPSSPKSDKLVTRRRTNASAAAAAKLQSIRQPSAQPRLRGLMVSAPGGMVPVKAGSLVEPQAQNHSPGLVRRVVDPGQGTASRDGAARPPFVRRVRRDNAEGDKPRFRVQALPGKRAPGRRGPGRASDGAQQKTKRPRRGTSIDEAEDDPAADAAQEEELLETIDRAKQAEAAARGPMKYAPTEFKLQDLATGRVATAAGTLGAIMEMDETMGRLARRADTSWAIDNDIARRLLRGEVVRFKDDAERERIVALAQQMSEATADKIAVQKGKAVKPLDVGFVSVGGEMRKELVDKVMRGKYELAPAAHGKDPKANNLTHVQRHLQLNSTYSPSQAQSMMATIEQLWGAAQAPAPKGKVVRR